MFDFVIYSFKKVLFDWVHNGASLSGITAVDDCAIFRFSGTARYGERTSSSKVVLLLILCPTAAPEGCVCVYMQLKSQQFVIDHERCEV